MLIILKSIAAGFLIGIGGIANLTVGGVAGAFLFSAGLLFICKRELLLYTGAVAHWGQGRSGLELLTILLGNIGGAEFAALAMCLTRFEPELREAAEDAAAVKMADSPLSLVMLGAMCNVLIYLAVETYKIERTERCFAVVIGVMAFVLCGFEHCIADAFYFAMAGALSEPRAYVALLAVVIGNTVGGLLCGAIRREMSKEVLG